MYYTGNQNLNKHLCNSILTTPFSILLGDNQDTKEASPSFLVFLNWLPVSVTRNFVYSLRPLLDPSALQEVYV